MAQSLSKVYVHIIFSVKNRENLLDHNIESSMHEYLGGICKGLDCNPFRIGGYKDHVHILCLLSRKITQMKLVEEIKKQSSKWIKTKSESYSNFYWQDRYGIFSINPAEIDKVVDYIDKQHEHHRQKNFQDEYRSFLKKYKVEYEERYLWE